MRAEDMVDLERYPLFALDSARGREVVRAGRAERAERGMAVLPGFLREETLEPLRRECGVSRVSNNFRIHFVIGRDDCDVRGGRVRLSYPRVREPDWIGRLI